jgi:hypothetical protein
MCRTLINPSRERNVLHYTDKGRKTHSFAPGREPLRGQPKWVPFHHFALISSSISFCPRHLQSGRSLRYPPLDTNHRDKHGFGTPGREIKPVNRRCRHHQRTPSVLMYLVELKPGKEELYRSSDELALAIRNGDVDARSRVYHRATAKWISITLHPQYRAIVSANNEELVIRPTRRPWRLGAATEQPLDAAAVDPSGVTNTLHRWRRPLALGLAALLLMSGLQLAFSGPRPPWSGGSQRAVTKAKASRKVEAKPRTTPSGKPQTVKASRHPALIAFTSRNAKPPEETASIERSAGSRRKMTAILPRAPKLGSRSLGDALTTESAKAEGNSPDALFARYSAAHDSTYSRLQAGMRVARLSRLFAPARLSPAGGVNDTRMSLAGAANFIRLYRQQQALIEQAYQDTVTAMAKLNRWSPKQVRAWYGREPRKETPTLELLSGSLLSSIDSVLGVLDAQAGAYKIRGTAIAFEEPTAGQKYGALRRRIKEQIDAAVAAGGATSGGPTGLLLQAIGTTSLPRET